MFDYALISMKGAADLAYTSPPSCNIYVKLDARRG